MDEKLLAVLTIDDPEDAVPVAEALLAGGVRAMELAWRTPGALAALERVVEAVPEMLAGVGTLLAPEQIHAARDAGAAFGVSPGLSVKLLDTARESGFPYAPGIMSPSDLHLAAEYGCTLLKFFPAESSGGLQHLRNINAPFKHLDFRYVVLGGLNETNMPSYLSEPSVSVIGGSWIASPDLIAAGNWEEIRCRAARARQIVDDASRG